MVADDDVGTHDNHRVDHDDLCSSHDLVFAEPRLPSCRLRCSTSRPKFVDHTTFEDLFRRDDVVETAEAKTSPVG